MIEVNDLDIKDLEFYKRYRERHNEYDHNLEIFDVVKIKHSLSHDIGYADEIGIITDLSINNYVYVFSHNNKSKEFGCCGFYEKELIKLNTDMTKYNELFLNMKEYLRRNEFNLSTKVFKEAWLQYKQGASFKKAIGENYIKKEKTI